MGKLAYNGNMRLWRGTLDSACGELLISVPEKKHVNAYLQSKGISTMDYLQLMDYVHQVLDQRCLAAEYLSNLEYWRTCNDPEVRVVQLTFKPKVDEKREG
jgi:hypothetical protein